MNRYIIHDLLPHYFLYTIDDYYKGFDKAFQCGNLSLAMLMTQDRACDLDWEWGLYLSCISGNLQLVNWIIDNIIADRDSYYLSHSFDWGLRGACRAGNRHLAELMIQRGANDWDSGLLGACQGGVKDLAEWMIQKGAIPQLCLGNGDKHCHSVNHE